MSKSNALETDFLGLILNGTAIANLADNASTGPLTQLWLAMHTADPGEAGAQNTNEATYTGYARVAVPRDNTGWTVSGDTANLTSNRIFPEATAGSETLTHFSVGTDQTGVGKILFKGTASPNVAIAVGVAPVLNTSTQITED